MRNSTNHCYRTLNRRMTMFVTLILITIINGLDDVSFRRREASTIALTNILIRTEDKNIEQLIIKHCHSYEAKRRKNQILEHYKNYLCEDSLIKEINYWKLPWIANDEFDRYNKKSS